MVERKDREKRDRVNRQALDDTLNEIMSKSDPMDIFNLVGSSSFGIQDLPIEKYDAFFNQLGRMQTFCKKYNLTVKDIQNNEELEERLKQWTYNDARSEDYSVENISEEEDALPNPDD